MKFAAIQRRWLEAVAAEIAGRTKSRWCRKYGKGRFQRHLAAATAASAFFSGIEALYSHYKNNFKYKAQWSPIVIAGAADRRRAWFAGEARESRRSFCPRLRRWQSRMAQWVSVTTREASRAVRAASRTLLYNVMYGPPIFAPLLFAACGFLGLLASMFRRER